MQHRAPHSLDERRSVLHILAPGRYGGLEAVVSLLAGSQLVSGYAVTVAAVVDTPGENSHLFDELRRQGVTTRVVRVPPQAYLTERKLIKSLCAELKPQIVHTHGYRADLLAAGVARNLGIATVTTVHGFTGGSRRILAYEWVQRWSFRRFDRVIAVSQPLAARVADAGVDPARVVVVPNVAASHALLSRLEARHALRLPDDAFVVGAVGRVVRAKGFDLLIDALSLPEAPAETILAIVGDGPDCEALKARARSHGISDRIVWCGKVDRAAAYYSAFDAFALVSRAEGSPISVLEAAQARVPVIASAVGGIPDMLSAKEAILVRVGDTAAIAKGIRDIRTDPVQAHARADRACRRVESDLSIERWVARYESAYRQCLLQ